jgi:hypothetical protein
MKTIPDVRLCRHVALCRLSQEDTQEKISVGIFWERLHNPTCLHNDEWMMGIEEFGRRAVVFLEPKATGQWKRWWELARSQV